MSLDATEPREARRIVLAAAAEVGFASAAVCDARPTEHPEALRAWLAAGKHGEMRYLAERLDLLLDPARLLPGARSVVVVADRYHDGRPDRRTSPRVGRVARYARGRDYHLVLRRRLERLVAAISPRLPGASWRICVDTAPLLERELAARSGLARIGKHTLAIARGLGSWILLGEVLTDALIAPSDPDPSPDPCGGCTRCLDACPTRAITPFSVDATRCVSYLTIEHRGEIAESFHAPLGDWIFGCDVCQEVCPHNQPTRRAARAPIEPSLAPRRAGFDLLEVLGWREEDRRAAFTTSALKRAKLAMIRRNAVIAAGNALAAGAIDPDEGRRLAARLRAIAADAAEEPLVRRTAEVVVARIAE